MKNLVISIVAVVFATLSFGQTTVKVLWLGNSYTGVNNLPALTQNVAQSTGDNIIYQANTPGGYRFLNHAASTTTMSKIFSDDWDYVTLQAQSQEPSWSQGQVQSQVFPYAKELCDSIRSNNGCTKPVFYMTWGRENGDASNCLSWPPVCSYTGMDSILNQNYQTMGAVNKALISPVGAVWHYLRDNYPALDLYSSDGSHPSTRGSYAAAVSFYTIFFQNDPTLVTFDYSIGNTDALIIRNAVKTIVYDSLYKWNVGKFEPISTNDFAFCDSIEVNNYWFNSDTIFSDTLLGQSEFGCDSIANYSLFNKGENTYISVDTSINNGDTLYIGNSEFTIAGNYQVILMNEKGCDSVINLNLAKLTSLEEDLENQINIYPNPATTVLNIDYKYATNISFLTIYNVLGEALIFNSLNKMQTKIDLSTIKKGIYIVKISNSEGELFISRFIKK